MSACCLVTPRGIGYANSTNIEGFGNCYQNITQEILSGFFPWDLLVVKFPLNGLRAQSRVSPAVGLLPLASGPACLGMAFPQFLVKQLYRSDSVVISSFVRTGYTTRRWGWVLGRIGYSITHNYPGRRKHGRPLKRLLDTWDQNGSTGGPTAWQIWWWWWRWWYNRRVLMVLMAVHERCRS